ncbi:hypothetical protein [Flavobacterium sp. GP15]|uniref:hypothetical protein n=1 Tax=Flavobacterium sp. GP15 TaxID=2758567 RepID=UPI00165D6E47|nr:hypothetical protein [Flavobacterium sp. GP15]
MKKSWSELTWNEKKAKFSIFAGIFLLLSIFTFFQTPHPKIEDLKEIEIKLDREPKFKKSRGKNSSNWLGIYSENIEYKLDGIDYKYLKIESFNKNIHKDTIITIKLSEENIYEMVYKNEDLTDYNLTQIHKTKNRTFCQIIFFSGFILNSFPLFFKRNPVYKNYYSEKKEINFIKIFAFLWFSSIIIAIIYLGDLKYISGSEFINH